MHRLNILPIVISLLFGVMIVSCNDDDQFTTSSDALLRFEEDTISLDTVISTLGSSTHRFKVFNPNSKGLHITTAELSSGGSSGFRVNIDGHSGPVLHDLDILKEDSIFIFAEITPPEQSSDTPVYVSDELVFHLESGVTQKLILEAYVQDVTFLHAPRIDGSETWSSKKPYVIYDSLVVGPNGVLTLDPGVSLYFHSGSYLGVHGQLVCNGTIEGRITFRGDRTDRIFPYLPYDRLDGQWGGVILYPESKKNLFDYVDIHGGFWGIDCPLSTVDDHKYYIQNSIIHNFSAGCGLSATNCIGQVLNSQISNSGGDCVRLVGGYHNFVHTTLAHFPLSTSNGTALYFTNVLNDTIYPLESANFYNCLITGYTTDEIVGNRLENSDASFNVLFSHSLINIKLSEEDKKSLSSMFVDCVNETDGSKDWQKDSDGAYDASIMWGTKNFLTIDHHDCVYDFSLTEESRARGIGDGKYVEYCPTDLHGVNRPATNPDAGCWQYRP